MAGRVGGWRSTHGPGLARARAGVAGYDWTPLLAFLEQHDDPEGALTRDSIAAAPLFGTPPSSWRIERDPAGALRAIPPPGWAPCRLPYRFPDPE